MDSKSVIGAIIFGILGLVGAFQMGKMAGAEQANEEAYTTNTEANEAGYRRGQLDAFNGSQMHEYVTTADGEQIIVVRSELADLASN
jgi:hypothetical protein